ncbi:16S rRNA methyltransferase [Actinobacillus delphinicola]|uniref:16S rRNA (guanine(1207)-N(2))-methyltransferase RsmC n=1 Tax=Actinobacillus delphinicola TaxID=51161 RepID=UPI002442B492|nr:16S rRNA (guanine(1207)-N(2))-methyltransferase RsmC [Actinobacillus delphinicola]MDG6897028.1 16S rRNA methyltransferase [Actinobacillus delphinicola]
MNISPESQVLERHLDLLNQGSVLFAGNVTDNFPQQLKSQKIPTHVWSWYFDYAKDFSEEACTFGSHCYQQADLILFYWTKNKLENQFQLLQLLSKAPIGQKVLIIGENRSGVRSAEKLLAPYGEIAKIDSARRCSLYHFELTEKVNFNFDEFWKTTEFMPNFNVASLPGVFSANVLDEGTKLLLSTLDNRHFFGDILDLGCGAGVIGTYIKQKFPNIHLVMSDIHAMALESSRRTLLINNLMGDVIASDVFSHIEGKFDVILSNPPFHDGLDTAYRAVTALITQAKWHLKEGGELRIVANRHLPYPDLLDQHLGSHEVLAKNNKFVVYSVHN